MTPDRLRDATDVLPTYNFTISHREEDNDDRRRHITRTAATSGTNFVRQQGDPSPRVFKFRGTILTQEQFDAMEDYYEACNTRTVFYRDYTGTEYEVLITAFSSARRAVLKNPRAPSLLHIWDYDLEMEVIF